MLFTGSVDGSGGAEALNVTGDVEFDGTVGTTALGNIDATGDLTVDAGSILNAGAITAATATIDGTVGVGGTVTSLDVAGSTSLGANVTTTGIQEYGAATITLDGLTLNAGSTGVLFTGTVDGNGGAEALNVTGDVEFDGTVGTTALGNIDATGDLTVDAGSILNAGAITAATATIDGAVGVGGTVTSVDIAGATNLGADITTTGLQEYGAASVTSGVTLDTGTGTGTLDFTSTIATGGNDLTLDAGPAANVTVAGAISGGGNLVIRDGDSISLSGASVASIDVQDATTSVSLGGTTTAATTIDIVSGGTVSLNDIQTTNGTISVAAAGQVDATGVQAGGAGSDVDISSTAGAIVIGQIVAADEIDLDAGTSIVDGTANDTVADLIAPNVELVTTDGGIGVDANGDIDTDADVIAISASASGTGGIDIRDVGSDGLTVGSVSGIDGITTNSGDIEITTESGTDSPLVILQAVTNNDANGDIILAADGAATDDLTIDADVTATGGDIFLYASDDIIIQDGTTLTTVTVSTSGTGNVEAIAGTQYQDGVPVATGLVTGDITMAANSFLTTIDGDISLWAPGNITLWAVNANGDDDSDTSTVTIVTTDGAVNDGDVDATNTDVSNIKAESVSIQADSGIGSATNEIEVDTRNLSAEISAGGDGGVFVSGTGTESMTLASIIARGTGNDATILADGDVLLGAINANTSASTVTIQTSAGAINDAAVDAVADITAGTGIALTATTGIGNSATIELDAPSLTLDAGTGNIDVASLIADPVTLDFSNDGSIDFTAAGDLLVDSVVSTAGNVTLTSMGGAINEAAATDATVDVSGAVVSLTAQDGIGDVSAPEITSSTLELDNTSTTVASNVEIRHLGDVTLDNIVRNQSGGSLRIEAVNGDLDTGDAAVTTEGGQISLLATDTDGTGTEVTLTVGTAGTISSAGGQINLNSADDIVLVGTASAGVGDVVLTADDNAIEAAGDDVGAINGAGLLTAGGTVSLAAAAGVGNTTTVQTDSDNLRVMNTVSGDIDVAASNTGDSVITIQNLAQAGGGAVTINAPDDSISVNESGFDANGTAVSITGGGLLTLRAGDGNDSNADVLIVDGVATDGSVTLRADDAVRFTSAEADIAAGSGDVAVQANDDGTADGNDGDAIEMINGAAITTAGDISLSAAGDISVGRLVSTNTDTTSDIITLTTPGAILDSGDAGGVDIEATAAGTSVSLAAGSIGLVSNAIDTAVATLSTNTNATNGDQFIDELDGLTIGTLNAGVGEIDLTVGGAVLDTAGNDTAVDVVAGLFELSDATGVGVNINDALNLNVAELDLTNGSGNAFITEADGFSANILDQGGGNLTLDVGGSLGDNNGASNNVVANTLTITGGIDVDLDTQISVLSLATGVTSIANAGGMMVSGTTTGASVISDSGDIVVGSLSGADLTLNAGGVIAEDTTDTATDITASQLTLVADAIGSSGSGALDIDASTLATDTSGGTTRNQFINDKAGGFAVDVLTTGGTTGTIELLMAGALTDGNADAAGADVTTNVIASGLLIDGGFNVVDIETQVATVDFDAAAVGLSNTGALQVLDSTITGATTLIATGNLTLNDLGNPGSINLTLDAGETGIINANASLANIGLLDIANSGGANFTGSVNATTLSLSDTADNQTITFAGNVTANAISTGASGFNVALNGAVNTVNSAATFSNTGTLTLGNGAADSTAFTNGLTAVAPSSIGLAGTLTTSGAAVSLGDVTLSGASEIDTGNASTGSIAIASVDGDGNTLTLDAGATAGATITLTGEIDDVSALTVRDAGGLVTFADVGQTTAGSVTITDSQAGVDFGGALAATTVTLTETNGAIRFLNDAAITTLATAGNYDLSFLGDQATVSNALIFGNSGDLTFGDEATDVVRFDGGATAGAIDLFGELQTGGSTLDLGAINVAGASRIETNGANLIVDTIASTATSTLTINAGAVTVADTVNNLSLVIEDSGGVTFQGIVGGTSPIDLDIVNTTAGQDIAFQQNVTLASLQTQAQGYGVTFGGGITTVQSAVNFTNSGEIVLGNETGDQLNFVAGLTNSSVGTVSLLGQLSSQGAPISLGNVDLGVGTSSVVTNDTVAAGADITFGAVDGENSTLVVDAGTGSNSVTFAGTTNLLALTTFGNNYSIAFEDRDNSITNAVNFLNTGGLTFGNDPLDSIEFTNGVVVNSLTTIAGTVSTVGEDISLDDVRVFEGGTARIETSGGAIDIGTSIQGTAGGGAESLILDAGTSTVTSNITLPDITGAADGLANITIASANDVTFSSVSLTGDLDQTSGLGTTSFTGPVSVDNATLVGNVFDFQNSVAASGAINIENTGLTTFAGGGTVAATAGLTTTGAVETNASFQTTGSNIDIQGALTLSDNTDIAVTTSGGDFSVGGITQGTGGGAGAETLTLNTGAGDITFSNTLLGAGSTGLTDITITNSGAIGFAEVDLTSGSIVQVNPATGNTVFNDTVEVASAELRGTNFIFADFTTSADLLIDAGGALSQTAGTLLTVGGLFDLTADDVELNALSVAGEIALNIDSDATLENDQALTLGGTVGGTLTVTADGSITLPASTTLSVGGASSFTADSVTLTDLSAAGTVAVETTGAVVIDNDQDLALEGTVGTNLTATAASGLITDDGALDVSGVIDLTANGTGGGVVLDNASNIFGSLVIDTSGAITVRESNDTVLDSIDGSTLTLNSAGNVSDGNNATITIAGAGVIDADGTVVLGDQPGDTISFGSLDITGSEITVDSAQSLVIAGLSAQSVTLDVDGDLTSTSDADIAITNDAVFNATNDIDLSASNNAFGTVSLSGNDISIDERDALTFDDVTADTLTATAQGEVTDIGVLSVSGLLSIDAGTRSVLLDSSANQFGVLDITGGSVEITESGGSNLGTIETESFSLNAGGNVTQESTSALSIAGIFEVDAGTNDITLTQGTNNFGSMDLAGDVIAITEASASRLEALSATTFSLVSGGAITQNLDGVLDVTGVATFQSLTSDISLNGNQNSFGSLVLDSDGSFTLNEVDGITLDGLFATDATLISEGDIIVTGTATVSGIATFTTDDNSNVRLTDPDNTFGSLVLSGAVIEIVEADSSVLSEVSASTSLTLTSGGDVTDVFGSSLQAGSAVITTPGDVILGDRESDDVRFDSIDITADNVSIAESDGSLIENLSASTLSLTAAGAISQAVGSSIDVTGSATFDAGSSDINLTSASNRFGSISITSAGDANLTDADSTLLNDISADTLMIVSGGDITDAGTIVTQGLALLDATGDITLDVSESTYGALSLIGEDISVQSLADITLARVTADSLAIESDRSIRDRTTQAGAIIEVAGIATLTAGQTISLGADGNGNTIRFGSVGLSGSTVEIQESDATILRDVDVTNLEYSSGGSLSQASGTGVVVGNSAILSANAGDGALTLTGNNDFDAVQIIAGSAILNEAGDITLSGFNVDSLTLTAGGNISESLSDTRPSVVRGVATFESVNRAGDVLLGDARNEFGTVNATGATVRLNEGGTLNLGVIDALTLTAISPVISQTLSSNLAVDGLAVFDAGTDEGSVDLTGASNRFGTLSVTTATGQVAEADAMVIDELDVGDTLTLTAAGDISDIAGSNFQASDAELTFDSTGDITLGDVITDSLEIGTLNVTGENVAVVVDDVVALGLIEATSLTVDAAGAIGQTNDSSVNVEGLATLMASNGLADITLVTGANRFGSVSLQGQDVSVVEVDDTRFGVVDVDSSLTYESGGAIVGDELVEVRGLATFSADGGNAAISLNNAGNRLSQLSLLGSDALVVNDAETTLVNVDVDSLSIESSSDVSGGAIQVAGLAMISATEGDIEIGTEGDQASIGSVDFTASVGSIVLLQEDDILIRGLDAETATIRAFGGDIQSAADGTLNVVERLVLDASAGGGLIDLTTSTNTLGILEAEADEIRIVEVGDINLDSIVTDSLRLTSVGGSILDEEGASIAVSQQADLTAQAGEVRLGDGSANATFGVLDLDAQSVAVTEADEMSLGVVSVQGDATLRADGEISQQTESTVSIGGRTRFEIPDGRLLLQGNANSISVADIIAGSVELNLTGETTLASIQTEGQAGSVVVTSDDTVNFGETGEVAAIRIDQDLVVDAPNIVFVAGSSENQVGGLSLTTDGEQGSAVEIRSSIQARSVGGSLTNPDGDFRILSPEVRIGSPDLTVELTTSGELGNGEIQILGVDANGNPLPGGSILLTGDVRIDSTDGGLSGGARVQLVSDGVTGGSIGAEAADTPTSLIVQSGDGTADLGSLVENSPAESRFEIDSLTILADGAIRLDDVYVAGNTTTIESRQADVEIVGQLRDAEGSVSILGREGVNLEQNASAGGSLTLASSDARVTTAGLSAGDTVLVNAADDVTLDGGVTAGSDIDILAGADLTATGDWDAQGNIVAASSGPMQILGSNVSAGGSVALFSTVGDLTTTGSIIAGTDILALASGTVSLGGLASETGGIYSLSEAGDIVFNADASSAGEFVALAQSGTISQGRDTTIRTTDGSTGNVTLSSLNGIAIASVQAAADVTLIISQSDPEAETPTFSRVNDAIAFGEGDTRQDLASANGSIVFLAPLANVGSQAQDQNFVQRASEGIFYGLEQGQFFSDDIGATPILQDIPSDVETRVGELFTPTTSPIAAATASFDQSESLIDGVISLDGQSSFDVAVNNSKQANASAGETGASSSSRSTAASQRDDDEEVAEVDEAAFQNLRNYDENPQGILLPEDQRFAVDADGSVYFMVTMTTPQGRSYMAPLYRVDLGSMLTTAQIITTAHNSDDRFGPRFLDLSMTARNGD